MKKKLSLKKIFIVALSLLFVFSIFNVGKVLADTKVFKLLDAKINEKSDNTDASIIADEDGIKTDITFHKVNEYVVYKLSLKNQDTKDYTIKSISDDNKDPYVSYVYDKHENETIKAGETKDILVKVSYDKEVTNVENREDKNPVKLSFSLVDKEGNEVVDNITIDNPKTNDNISKYIVLSIISLSVIILLVIKNKKTKKVMVLVLMLTPLITKAIDSGFELTINNDIKFYDKLVVTLNINSEEETKTLSYGDKVELPNPEKTGYKFLGWYNGSEKYDPESTVSNDITITPKYEIITYTISYTGLEGTIPVVNNIEYNVETESFTLTNPTKLGYSFTGWTGTFSDVPQTRVTIDKGTTGNIELNAVFSANDDTDYKVIHKYEKLTDGEYDIEVEELKGTTDSTVRPQTIERTGFNSPEEQDLVITGDGEAELTYVYTRETYTLSYNEDVESEFAPGEYKYGTTIIATVKQKEGYTFDGWAYNTNSKLVYLDNNQNETIDAGDSVFIGDDWFYVIAEPENGEVKLLPKYNISSSGRQTMTQEGNNITFSSSNYWNGSSDFEPWGDSSYNYIYRDKEGNETNNNLKDRVNSYKNYLDGLGIVDISDARLMSYDEVTNIGCSTVIDSCPEYVSNQFYWLGSAADNNRVWYVLSTNRVLIQGTYASSAGVTGIRPVLTISQSDISAPWNGDAEVSFDIEKNTNIEPSYEPKTNTMYTVVHKKQINEQEGYEIEETQVLYGQTGIEVTPDTKTFEYYDTPSKQTATIKADGSTIVEYLYNINHYVVTFDPNAGDAHVSPESELIDVGDSVSLPTPTRHGYEFKGWYENSDCNGESVQNPYTPNKNITLYANWEVNNNPTAYLIDSDGDLDASLGDEVHIGDDMFYYIGRDDNNNLKLLAKYNLDYDYKQSENNYVPLEFSSTNYWASAGSSSSSSSSSSSGSGSSSSYSFNADTEGYKYVYRDGYNNDISENNLTNYVNNYKDYITSETEIDVIDARLMAYAEAAVIGCSTDSDSCPTYVSNQHYWLGSANDDRHVWIVNAKTTNYNLDYYHYSDNSNYGVRAVIIVSESDISMPWENNNTVLYSDTNNDGNISLGDVVRIGSEGFRVIDTPSNGEVKLLAMYNLDYYSSRQLFDSDYIVYSDSNYWKNSSDYTPFGSSSYEYIYRTTANRFTTDGDTNNNLKTRINSYKDYLNGLNLITVSDARLMSYEEALVTGCEYESLYTCPEWMANQDYWLGSAYYSEYIQSKVFSIDSNNRYLRSLTFSYGLGVRPVITISESDIPTN